MQRAPTLAVSALLLLVPGASAQEARPGPGDAPPTAELVTVEVAQRSGPALTAERGRLAVPVNRARPSGDRLSLEFHRFACTGDAPAEPIYLLTGGPGFRGPGADLVRPGFYEDRIASLAAVAEVVVVGQRGFGSSGPDLLCGGPGWEDLEHPGDEAARAAALAAACRACREHWESKGVDLDGFTVTDLADDVVAVADALGHGRITLVGGSFGSHWGMALLRRHPARIARAVLHGLEGPDHTYDRPSHVLAALERIAAEAERDPVLAPLVPEGGILAGLRARVAALEAEPLTIDVGLTRVLLDARRLRELALGVRARASSREGIQGWPADMIRIARGELDDAARAAVRQAFRPRLPNAAFFTLDCGSGISAARREELARDPARAVVGNLNFLYDSTCPTWGADLGEEFRGGLEIEVPCVLVHGTWDTSTPFENALELQPSFKNHRLVVVERGSHGALAEARVASPSFRDALNLFLATGDLEVVPDRVELAPPKWAVPSPD